MGRSSTDESWAVNCMNRAEKVWLALWTFFISSTGLALAHGVFMDGGGIPQLVLDGKCCTANCMMVVFA